MRPGSQSLQGIYCSLFVKSIVSRGFPCTVKYHSVPHYFTVSAKDQQQSLKPSLLKTKQKEKIFEFACHSCRQWIITPGKCGNTTHIIQLEAWFILCLKWLRQFYKSKMSFLCNFFQGKKVRSIIFNTLKQTFSPFCTPSNPHYCNGWYDMI